MSFKTFFWIEDSKDGASYIFWKNIMKQLCPEVEVESKKNNRLSAWDKMRNIYDKTSLKEQFSKAGLEVSL